MVLWGEDEGRKEENQGGNSEAGLVRKRMPEATTKGSTPSLTLVKLDRVVFKSMILSACSACHSGPLLSHSLHLGGGGSIMVVISEMICTVQLGLVNLSGKTTGLNVIIGQQLSYSYLEYVCAL